MQYFIYIFICIYLHIYLQIFKDVKTIPSLQAGQKQTVRQICPMGPYVPCNSSHIWNYFINSRGTCENSKAWTSTAFVQTHDQDSARRVSPHYLISNKGTLPRRKWRTRIVCSWWPKGVGTEFLTLLLLRAATFGQHQDPPSGVSFLTPVGPDMTSGLIW